jgi:hypothetical protein
VRNNGRQLTVASDELVLVALKPALKPGKGTKTIMEFAKTVAYAHRPEKMNSTTQMV